jgi:exodeoxyribonuclease VII small subunit
VTETPAPAQGTAGPPGSDEIAALTFDQALDELRVVVRRLEEGGLPLEESIALYERGAALHEHCGTLLDAAELRIQRLVDGAGGGAPRALDLRPEDEDER